MLPDTPTDLRTIRAHLTRDEWRGIQNLAHAWGPEHVLARWGRLRLEIIWVRYL
jgi:hypothetical protein